MSKRSYDFNNKNYAFRNEIYGEKDGVKIDELYFDDKLSNEEEIVEYMFEMMRDKGSVNFVSAPTNAGKTYLVNELFKKLNEVEKTPTKEEILYMFRFQDDPEKCYESFVDTAPTYMNVIAMPSNPQTIQVAKKYGLQCLVGGKDFKALDMKADGGINVGMVYDMAKVLIDMLKSDEFLHINLVVDESHELTSSTFRGEALAQLRELIPLVITRGGTVTYLTASYTEMSYLTGLKHILFCNKRVEKVDFEHLKLIIVDSDKSIDDITLNILKDKKGLVLFNKKEGQKDLQKELSLMNKKVYYVNSDEKQSIIDKKTNEKIYKNKMMNCIVNEEILPEDIDLGIATKMLESGTNIVGIGSEDNQPFNFDTIHIIRDSQDLNLSSIEQFVNRIRFSHNNHYIIIKKSVIEEENEKVYDFSLRQTFRFCFSKLQQQMEYLKAEMKLLRDIKFRGEENVEELVEKVMKDTLKEKNNFDGLSNSMGGSIRYEDGRLFIEYKFFLNYCLNKYNQSLFYNKDKFVKELEKIFNKKVEVIEMKDKDVDLKIDRTTLEDYKKNLLEQLKGGAPLFPSIMETKFYKEALKLCSFIHKNIEECLEIVLSKTDKELQELYNEISKDTMKNMGSYDMKELRKVLEDNKQLKDIKNESTREEISKIVNNRVFLEKMDKSMKENGLSMNEFIDHYCKVEDDKELNRFINDKRIVKNNINYNDGYKELLRDHANFDQLVILEYIKNVKNYKIYKNKIEEKDDKIDELIKELLDRTGHKYTRNKVINFIKSIYTYREKDEKIKGKKVKCIYLNSLRLKM